MPPPTPTPPEPDESSYSAIPSIGGFNPNDFKTLKALADLGGDYKVAADAMKQIPQIVKKMTSEMEELTKMLEKHGETVEKLNEVSLKEKETEEKLKELEEKNTGELTEIRKKAYETEKARLQQELADIQKNKQKIAEREKHEKEEIERLKKANELRRLELEGHKKLVELNRATLSGQKAYTDSLKILEGLTTKINRAQEVNNENIQAHTAAQEKSRLELEARSAADALAKDESKKEAEAKANTTARQLRLIELQDQAGSKIAELVSKGVRLAEFTTTTEIAQAGPGKAIDIVRKKIKGRSQEEIDEIVDVMGEIFQTGKLADPEVMKRLGIAATAKEGGGFALDIQGMGKGATVNLPSLASKIGEEFGKKRDNLLQELVAKMMDENKGITQEAAEARVKDSREFKLSMADLFRKEKEATASIETPEFKELRKYLPYLQKDEAQRIERRVEEGQIVPKWASMLINSYERSFGQFSSQLDELHKIGGGSTKATKILVYLVGGIAMGLGYFYTQFGMVAKGLMMIPGIGKTVISMGNGLTTLFRGGGVLSALAGPFRAFGSFLAGIFPGLRAMANAIPMFGKFFGFLPKIFGAIPMFFRLGQVLFPPLFALVQIITAVVGAFRGFGKDGIRGAIVGAISQLISGFTFGLIKFESVYNFLLAAMTGLFDWFESVKPMLYRIFIRPFQDLFKEIQSVMSGAGGFVEKMIKIATSVYFAIMKVLYPAIIAGIKFLLVDLGGWLINFLFKTLPKFIGDLMKYIRGVYIEPETEEMFRRIFEHIDKAFNDFIQAVMETLMDVMGQFFDLIFPGAREKVEEKKAIRERQDQIEESKEKQAEAAEKVAEANRRLDRYERAKVIFGMEIPQSAVQKLKDASLHKELLEISEPEPMSSAELKEVRDRARFTSLRNSTQALIGIKNFLGGLIPSAAETIGGVTEKFGTSAGVPLITGVGRVLKVVEVSSAAAENASMRLAMNTEQNDNTMRSLSQITAAIAASGKTMQSAPGSQGAILGGSITARNDHPSIGAMNWREGNGGFA